LRQPSGTVAVSRHGRRSPIHFGAGKKRFKFNNFVPEFLIDGKRLGGMLLARFVEHFIVLKK